MALGVFRFLPRWAALRSIAASDADRGDLERRDRQVEDYLTRLGSFFTDDGTDVTLDVPFGGTGRPNLESGEFLLGNGTGGILSQAGINHTDLNVVAWTAVSGGVGFENSWVNYGAGEQDAEYRKVGDCVELRGVVKSGSVGVFAIFTLPVGYRPPTSVAFAVASNDAFGRLLITSGGAVQLRVGSNVYADLFVRFSVT